MSRIATIHRRIGGVTLCKALDLPMDPAPGQRVEIDNHTALLITSVFVRPSPAEFTPGNGRPRITVWLQPEEGTLTGPAAAILARAREDGWKDVGGA